MTYELAGYVAQCGAVLGNQLATTRRGKLVQVAVSFWAAAAAALMLELLLSIYERRRSDEVMSPLRTGGQ